MAEFNRAMSEMLNVFSKELGGKVTVQEIEAMPRLGFLAIPGTEYSDRVYREFYPRKETAEVRKATEFLKQIALNRLKPSAPAAPTFSLSEFTQAMSELLRVFTEECGGQVTLAELGSNLRLSMFAKTGVEQSDLLYKEFYPNRETNELVKAIAVLKGIVAKRRSNVSPYGTPRRDPATVPAPRREPQTMYSPYTTPMKVMSPSKTVDTTPDSLNYFSPAKNLVQNAMGGGAETHSPTPPTTTSGTTMVFDYESFTMKPVASFI